MTGIEYRNEVIHEVLRRGTHMGMGYAIVNRGIHPCAYVVIGDTGSIDSDTINDRIEVHGGVTYFGKASLCGIQSESGTADSAKDGETPSIKPDDICFGWDYGHSGDWCGYMEEEINIWVGNMKYTVDEIEEECRSAIEQYLEISDER